ncbi:MAG: hypothetical protein P4M07_01090 [Xanthobacteraceae bacterium]|nr:hypothetical protein [Xanthobacteraceae bacterium]
MASPRGGHPASSAAIDHGIVVIPVAIAVVILLDDDRVAIPMFVAIVNDPAVAVPVVVVVAIMSRADCHSSRSDANSNLFRARRDGGTNARKGGNYQCVFHHVLLKS